MSAITISPDPVSGRGFVAVRGSQSFVGSTFGEALDGLTNSFGEPNERTVVILKPFQPDAFFTAAQQQRMNELMTQFREANDRGAELPKDVRAELEALIKTELIATGERAKSMADQLRS